MGDSQETRAIGQRGFLIRTFTSDEVETVVFRVYSENDKQEHSFVDYEITNYDCEVVIIDPDAAFVRNNAGDFLDYTSESMGISK